MFDKTSSGLSEQQTLEHMFDFAAKVELKNFLKNIEKSFKKLLTITLTSDNIQSQVNK